MSLNLFSLWRGYMVFLITGFLFSITWPFAHPTSRRLYVTDSGTISRLLHDIIRYQWRSAISVHAKTNLNFTISTNKIVLIGHANRNCDSEICITSNVLHILYLCMLIIYTNVVCFVRLISGTSWQDFYWQIAAVNIGSNFGFFYFILDLLRGCFSKTR